MSRFLLIALFGLALLNWAPRARACSIAPGADFPSNYEMVENAEAIVLARASQALPPLKDSSFPRLSFEILQVVKGQYPDKTLVNVVFSTDAKHYRGRSAIGDFGRARPGTYAGACVAGDYFLKANYLLFLSVRRGANGAVRWEIGAHILARDREEVTGVADPWTQAVMRYVEIARLNDYDQEKIALTELRSQAARGDDPQRFPVGLVADVDRHFAAASPRKSYDDLLELYQSTTDERRRDAAVYAMARAKHPQAFDLIYQRFGGLQVEYFGAVKNPRSVEIVGEEFLRRKALIASGEWQGDAKDVAKILARIATPSDEARMVRALRVADAEGYESEVLANWFLRHPSPAGIAALREIVGHDYRKKWRVASSLVELGDPEMVRWAKNAVSLPDYVLPIYTLAMSPLAEADRAATQIIASGDAKRIEILVYAYRNEADHNPRRWQRLREIAAWKKRRGLSYAASQQRHPTASPTARSPRAFLFRRSVG